MSYFSRTLFVRMMRGAMLLAIAGMLQAACSLSDLTQVDRGERGNLVDQDVIESAEGARRVYYYAVATFAGHLSNVSLNVGRFTDELSVRSGVSMNAMELRRLQSDGSSLSVGGTYRGLQSGRIQAQQAGDLLRRYGGTSAHTMLAHTYAIRAYLTILLGELYCSGIPLTSAPYGGALEYTPGFTTTGMFERALVLADSGMLLTTDSIPVLTMLRVARGRALLNLGRYSEAAAAVAVVETTHGATVTYQPSGTLVGGEFWTNNVGSFDRVIVRNAKGVNGLRWLADTAIGQDPRIPVSKTTNGQQFQSPIRPLKFSPTAGVTLVVADGIEARLIEAEALIQPANAPAGNWLAVLNTLRRTALPAGATLADTTDPGTVNGRLNLLFRERAFWLYLTGHRLGDLRRLIRQYGRPSVEVFPIGPAETGALAYGDEYVMIPALPQSDPELDANPYYRGCEDLNP